MDDGRFIVAWPPIWRGKLSMSLEMLALGRKASATAPWHGALKRQQHEIVVWA